MNIIRALKGGMSGLFKSWKGVLIIWLVGFIMLVSIKIPLISALENGFGNSMITERLTEAIEIESIADLGTDVLKGMGFSLARSLFFAWITMFLLNIFFSGGIFDYLRDTKRQFTLSGFLGASARNFRSFFLIRILSGMIIVALTALAILFLVLFNTSGIPGLRILYVFIEVVILLFISQMFLVADYARAGKTGSPELKATSSMGYGFKTAFGNILSSLPVMIIVTIVYIVVIILAFNIIMPWFPQNGFGGFALFLSTQIVSLLGIALKVWRFGSVSCLMNMLKNRL